MSNPVSRWALEQLEESGANVVFKNGGGDLGVFDAGSNSITINLGSHGSLDEVVSTFVHEVGHEVAIESTSEHL